MLSGPTFWPKIMRRQGFTRLLSSLPKLSPHQLKKLNQAVGTLNQRQESREISAKRLDVHPACPHCAHATFTKWGNTVGGAQRYRCGGCARTFTALTGTPLARVHAKARLLDNAGLMALCLSVRKAAKQLGVHRNTAWNYRHRMMPLLASHQPQSLEGVLEADEVFFRESFKGKKSGMPRVAYKRGSPASKRGVSTEQKAVLTAVARGSRASLIAPLPSVPTRKSVADVLRPVVKKDSVLCSDSSSVYPKLKDDLGIIVRQIPRGMHSLGPYHINNVNALHSRMKRWLHPFRGVATKYLPGYLAWFQFFDMHRSAHASEEFLLDSFGALENNTI